MHLVILLLISNVFKLIHLYRLLHESPLLLVLLHFLTHFFDMYHGLLVLLSKVVAFDAHLADTAKVARDLLKLTLEVTNSINILLSLHLLQDIMLKLGHVHLLMSLNVFEQIYESFLLEFILLDGNMSLSLCLLHQVLHGIFELLVLLLDHLEFKFDIIYLSLCFLLFFISVADVLILTILIALHFLLKRIDVRLGFLILFLEHCILFFFNSIGHLHSGGALVEGYEFFLEKIDDFLLLLQLLLMILPLSLELLVKC